MTRNQQGAFRRPLMSPEKIVALLFMAISWPWVFGCIDTTGPNTGCPPDTVTLVEVDRLRITHEVYVDTLYLYIAFCVPEHEHHDKG